MGLVVHCFPYTLHTPHGVENTLFNLAVLNVGEMAMHPVSVVQINRLPEDLDPTDTLQVPRLSSTPRRNSHLEETCHGKYFIFFGLASS
jgi:hypothetical protein